MAVKETSNELLLDGILVSLEDMGHHGPVMEEGALKAAVEAGMSSDMYTCLVCDLCSELKASIADLQESVSRPSGPAPGPEDTEAFQMELKGFLMELHCPHLCLTGDMNMLAGYQNRLLVLDYLVSELLAARLTVLKQGKQEVMEVNGNEQSQSIAGNMTAILKAYGFSRPPANVSVKQIFDKIIGKTRKLLEDAGKDYLGVGLVAQPLSDAQWLTLEQINKFLAEEYSTRRQMLLTRCDVTIQSFGWSHKIKKGGKEEKVAQVYQERRQDLSVTAPVSIARVLAAKGDLLTIRKTNDLSVRTHTQCSINKLLIGKVPDRGGRPRETRPPPEMPAFKKRSEGPRDQRPKGGGGGRGGRGGAGGKGKGRGGGSRVQGGWGSGHGGGGGRGGWSRQKSSDSGYHGQQQQQQYYS